MNKRLTFWVNIILFVLIISASYAWMLTAASHGEIAKYDRNLVISATDIDVKLYRYIDGIYVLVDSPTIVLDNIAPNDKIQFRFDITNNNATISTSKILLNGISGDIDILKNKITIGSSSPKTYEFTIGSRIEYDKLNNYAYIRFDNDFKVEPRTKISLYWYIYIDKMASNEIANKSITINNISFIKP